MDKICLHCFVSGRVQGVFFRRHTKEKAEKLGLTGWVKNTDDERVEILVYGKPNDVEVLREWLWEGPSAAEVSGVEIYEVSLQQLSAAELSQFEIKEK